MDDKDKPGSLEDSVPPPKGAVKITLTGPDGKVKAEGVHRNLVVTAGKNYLTAWLQAASQAGKFMSYMALGTGSTAVAAGDTALQTEFSGGGYARQIGVLTNVTNTWTNTAVFGPGVATGAITEAGLFSAVTTGTMFSHLVFSAYNKQALDTITFAWTITWS